MGAETEQPKSKDKVISAIEAKLQAMDREKSNTFKLSSTKSNVSSSSSGSTSSQHQNKGNNIRPCDQYTFKPGHRSGQRSKPYHKK